ncbi:hypothetical protein HMPREF1008_01673 [Olsenella sp. oral taxon 809 str. F0356]|nr:hypothetical protein HMPREF1008_01673 [Olsenella sp. oral taxon 809 str. F0356]
MPLTGSANLLTLSTSNVRRIPSVRTIFYLRMRHYQLMCHRRRHTPSWKQRQCMRLVDRSQAIYIHREIEPLLKSCLDRYAVLLLVGPRGSGKTTLLQHCLGEGCQFLSAEEMSAMDTTLADPNDLLAGGNRTLVLKDAERRPRLVAAAVADGRPGGLVLEAQFVTERLSAALQSLTKHVRKLRLGTLSLRELLGQTGRGPHVPAPPRSMASTPAMDEGALWEHIWRGGQPVLLDATTNWDDFYSA